MVYIYIIFIEYMRMSSISISLSLSLQWCLGEKNKPGKHIQLERSMHANSRVNVAATQQAPKEISQTMDLERSFTSKCRKTLPNIAMNSTKECTRLQ